MDTEIVLQAFFFFHPILLSFREISFNIENVVTQIFETATYVCTSES